MYQAVFSLKMLQRLHFSGLLFVQDGSVNDPRPMKEIVYYTILEDFTVLTKTIQQSGPVLEVLVLHSYFPFPGTVVDIAPENLSPISLLGAREGAPAEPLSNVAHLSALTHLDLAVLLTDSSLKYLSTILPRMDLIHFGCDSSSHGLLQHCNLASLKSLSIMDANYANLKLLLDTMGDGTAAPTWDGLEQLYIRSMTFNSLVLVRFLQSAQLTRLYLDDLVLTALEAVLEAVNLSKLQEISICDSMYYPSAECALAKRINEFSEALMVRLDEISSTQYLVQGGKPRTVVGSSETLPRHRVSNLHTSFFGDHHYRFLQHVLPVYSY